MANQEPLDDGESALYLRAPNDYDDLSYEESLAILKNTLPELRSSEVESLYDRGLISFDTATRCFDWIKRNL